MSEKSPIISRMNSDHVPAKIKSSIKHAYIRFKRIYDVVVRYNLQNLNFAFDNVMNLFTQFSDFVKKEHLTDKEFWNTMCDDVWFSRLCDMSRILDFTQSQIVYNKLHVGAQLTTTTIPGVYDGQEKQRYNVSQNLELLIEEISIIQRKIDTVRKVLRRYKIGENADNLREKSKESASQKRHSV